MGIDYEKTDVFAERIIEVSPEKSVKLQLVRPNARLLDSYISACEESYEHVHDKYILHDPSKVDEWRDSIFEKCIDNAKGVGLPEGWIPFVTLWLVCDDYFIGACNIRLQLPEALRKYIGQLGGFIRMSERGKIYGQFLLPMALEAAFKLGVRPILYSRVLPSDRIEAVAATAAVETDFENPDVKNMQEMRRLFKSGHLRTESDVAMVDGKMRKIRRYWFS